MVLYRCGVIWCLILMASCHTIRPRGWENITLNGRAEVSCTASSLAFLLYSQY